MGTDIALSDIRQRLTDQIKAQFADLIPQEEWEGLIERETAGFIEKELPRIVRDCLGTKLREVIKAEFDGPRWNSHWDGYYQAPSDAIRKLIREHSDTIVEALVSQLVAGAVESMKRGF